MLPPVLILVLLYVLTTSKVIPGFSLTCDSVYSWWLCSAISLGNQTINTMTWYPTQSQYPDTDPTSSCPILIMPSSWLGSDKYQFYKLLIWCDQGFDSTISCTQDPCFTESVTAPDRYCYLCQPIRIVSGTMWFPVMWLFFISIGRAVMLTSAVTPLICWHYHHVQLAVHW